MISEINQHWNDILQFVEDNFGSKPDLNKLLLLIGIREIGEVREKFEKEEKVQLMHIAVCRVLSPGGYYVINGKDENGWPNWEKVKDVPYLDVFEQETFLRQHIVEYFLSEEII
jgi:sensor domain CHASE-containing protein